MISFATERLLTMGEAARMLPRFRQGKRVDIATVFRWALRGVKGVKLETIQIGGRKCTSAQALQRFFEALTAQATGGAVDDPLALVRRDKALRACGVRARTERGREAAVKAALEREGL
jgi:hypothetical protein